MNKVVIIENGNSNIWIPYDEWILMQKWLEEKQQELWEYVFYNDIEQ